MNNDEPIVKNVKPLGFPWETQDPFLFCVYHADAYPKGNSEFGPQDSLDERLMGNSEGPKAPMIVKVRTDRIGATPVSGAGGKSNNRDVLERL